METKYLTVTQAALLLNICESVVYGWCGNGLPHYRFGLGRGTIRIAEADLAAWVQSLKTQKGQETKKSPVPKCPIKLKHLEL